MNLNHLAGIIAAVLNYALIFFLYVFLYQALRLIVSDLRTTAAPKAPLVFYDQAVAKGRLIVVEGSPDLPSGTALPLGETVSIGRHEEHNDIVINAPVVSHEHACITFYRGNYWLSDLNSTNGTFVNGVRVSAETALNDGDLIRIGPITFRFER